MESEIRYLKRKRMRRSKRFKCFDDILESKAAYQRRMARTRKLTKEPLASGEIRLKLASAQVPGAEATSSQLVRLNPGMWRTRNLPASYSLPSLAQSNPLPSTSTSRQTTKLCFPAKTSSHKSQLNRRRPALRTAPKLGRALAGQCPHRLTHPRLPFRSTMPGCRNVFTPQAHPTDLNAREELATATPPACNVLRQLTAPTTLQAQLPTWDLEKPQHPSEARNHSQGVHRDPSAPAAHRTKTFKATAPSMASPVWLELRTGQQRKPPLRLTYQLQRCLPLTQENLEAHNSITPW